MFQAEKFEFSLAQPRFHCHFFLGCDQKDLLQLETLLTFSNQNLYNLQTRLHLEVTVLFSSTAVNDLRAVRHSGSILSFAVAQVIGTTHLPQRPRPVTGISQQVDILPLLMFVLDLSTQLFEELFAFLLFLVGLDKSGFRIGGFLKR